MALIDGPKTLPPLQVQEAAGQPSTWVVKVMGLGEHKGLLLEGGFEVWPVAGAPVRWALSLVASLAEGEELALSSEGYGRVACGEEVHLEVEAADQFGNR